MALRCLILGHDFVRHPENEYGPLADGWGYLQCQRCTKSGFLDLSENEYRDATDTDKEIDTEY